VQSDLRPTRWWGEESPELIASELERLTGQLEETFQPQRDQWVRSLSLYEPRPVSGLDAASYLSTDRALNRQDLHYPLGRSLVDTVTADIAGRQRPKPIFMTSGADWKTQRRAKKLSRFVAGQMSLRQGKYLDVWDLRQDSFAGAAILGMNFIHVYGDPEEGRVRCERVSPAEMLWDPDDAQYGEPSNLFRVRWLDEDVVLETYVEAPLRDNEIDEEEATTRRNAIASARARDGDRIDGSRAVRQVKFIEGWHLPIGEQEGRHCASVGSCLLVDEEWCRDDFPFFIERWAHEREGFGGVGLIEEAQSMAVELDDALQFAQRQHRLNAGRRIFLPDTADVEDSDLEANYEETVIRYRGAQPPTETNVAALNPSTLGWIQLVRSFAHEATGVSQTGAQGRTEQGVKSGIALRTMVDIATKRFSVKARAYENGFIRLAQLIVRAVQDLVEMGVKVRSSFPGEDFFDDLEWSDVNLEEDLYTIQIDTVSALADRAAGRIATTEEALQSGLITPEAFSRIVPPAGTLDLENENNPLSKQEQYLNSLIDRYLDAEEDDSEFKREAPDGFLLDLGGAVRQFVGAYFDAKLGQAPDFNLQLLRDYIKQLDDLVKKAAAAMQAAQAPQAPPGAAPPMGAPGPQMAAA
jgi:hypothetical protein